MNILVFSTVFYPAIGGIENQTLILANEFVKKGNSVKVITREKQHEKLKDIEIFYNPGIVDSLTLFRWCDVFYMPNISLKGVWMLLFNPGKRWVISHNDFSLMDKDKFNIRLKKYLLRFARKNIAVSASVAEYLNTKSVIIYNCYDEKIFKLYPEEQRTITFTFLGRLVTQKGCHLLLDACARLSKPFSLQIIGDGVERANLEQQVEMLGLQESVHFLGFQKEEELGRLLNRTKVLIIPATAEEGFGMVALEALACGCIVIASDAAGLVESVNGFGAIFPMGDTDKLAAMLQAELDSPREYEMSEELQTYLSARTPKIVSMRYLAHFND